MNKVKKNNKQLLNTLELEHCHLCIPLASNGKFCLAFVIICLIIMGWTVAQIKAHTLTFLLPPSCRLLLSSKSSRKLPDFRDFSLKDSINRPPSTCQRSKLFFYYYWIIMVWKGYFSSKNSYASGMQLLPHNLSKQICRFDFSRKMN